MGSSCSVCGVSRDGASRPETDAVICPRCVTEVFAARFLGRTEISDDDPTCIWAPAAGREGPRSTRNRLEDLQELGDRSSRASMLPPLPPGVGLGEVSLSVRDAIRGVDLFPAAPAASVKAAEEPREATREREPTSSRPRPVTFDRVLLAVAVGGSLVMGYKVGEDRAARAGRSSLSTPELSGKMMANAAERAHRIKTSFQVPSTPPPPPEPVKALPEAQTAALPPPSWRSHVPGTSRGALPVAKAPAPTPAAEEAAAPVAEAEAEEPTPSVPPPAISLVEAMAAAVKAKP